MFIWTAKERATLNGAIEKHGMLHQSMKLAEARKLFGVIT